MRGAGYAHRMPTLVFRKSVDDERVGGPFSCANPNEMARVPGLLTLEERMPWLLSTHETATFHFEYPGIDIHENMTRARFESASARVSGSILERLDRTLERAGIAPSDKIGRAHV